MRSDDALFLDILIAAHKIKRFIAGPLIPPDDTL